jgi:hypothetical protein
MTRPTTADDAYLVGMLVIVDGAMDDFVGGVKR